MSKRLTVEKAAAERANLMAAMGYVDGFKKVFDAAKRELTDEAFSIFTRKVCRMIGWEQERVFINPSSKSRSGSTEFKNAKQQAAVIREITSRMGLDNPSYLKSKNPEDGIKSVAAFIAFNFLPIDSSELYR